ncbi:phosphotransferase [Nocardia sp. NPDC046473]|uniref:phosphotransferase enzyme family protein n=1 Tax=Nocardia sp. NPDC046473 TaxID=3155733 RepID=UPI0033CB2399
MPATSSDELLAELLAQAELPAAASSKPLSGRGFDNEIAIVTLVDDRRVVLRRFREPRTPEFKRARFLADHGVPAPALLAANEQASLVAFVDGAVLGDLIDAGQDTDQVWRLVGAAYARVHTVGFPAGLAGEDLPADRIVLDLIDPAEQLHTLLDEAEPPLRRLLPECAKHLPALHDLVRETADSLRRAPTALGHGDINMWNIMVGSDQATLIDWDFPRVADPAKEIALLDKHASLFNGRGLPPAFFTGYGRGPTEPNTSIHRVLQTLGWAVSSDWAELDEDPLVPAELKELRNKVWLPTLLNYVRGLPEHIARLRTVIDAPAH